jgi:hypothetical protein
MATPSSVSPDNPQLVYPQKDESALKSQLGSKVDSHLNAPNVPQPPPGYRYRQIVRDILASRTAATNRGREHSVSFYEPKAEITLFGAPMALTPVSFTDLLFNTVFPSFPDFTLRLLEETYKEEGNVATADIYMVGTHTGAPFSFPPGANQPAIATTYRRVENIQPFRVEFSQNNKIQRLKGLRAYDGGVTGPMNLYLQIGGALPTNTKNFLPHAQKFMSLVNAQPANKPQELLILFSNDALFQFAGAPPVKPVEFVETIGKLRESFPDFTVSPDWNSFTESGARVQFLVTPSGTHTGTPFSFPQAGAVEPLKASGKKWQTPTERVTAVFDPAGKVVRVDVEALSASAPPVGALGTYLALGGKPTPTRQQQLIHATRQAYAAFASKNIESLLGVWAPVSELIIGEDNGGIGGARSAIPWKGRWSPPASFFAVVDASSDILKWNPTSITAIDDRRVITTVEEIIRSKKTGKIVADSLTHELEFDANLKVVRCVERADYAHIEHIYKE